MLPFFKKKGSMAPGGSTSERVIESSNGESRRITTLNIVKQCKACNTAVEELLECPVCRNVMCHPIHQCASGHTLCSKCQSMILCCPSCRDDLGNIRCSSLERVAVSLELPCAYQIFGCQDVLSFQSRLSHKLSCRYRPYDCPYVGRAKCPVTGDIPLLTAHLMNHHKVDMHEGSTFNHRYVKSDPQDVENATWMLTVFRCFDYQFCLHFEAFNLRKAPVFMAFIRFMGEDSYARKFSHSLEVSGNGRKMTWQGVPRSIRDSHLKVRESNDGLIIQRNMALFLSGGNRAQLENGWTDMERISFETKSSIMSLKLLDVPLFFSSVNELHNDKEESLTIFCCTD